MLTPKAAAAAATDKPPDPAPITQMSGVRVFVMRAPSETGMWPCRIGAGSQMRDAHTLFTTVASAATSASAMKAMVICGVTSSLSLAC